MSTTSIQVRLDLTAIRGSVASFGSGDRSEYCAVMEVFGSQQSLAKLDDAKQEAVLAGYAQFLNSLTFSVPAPGTRRASRPLLVRGSG